MNKQLSALLDSYLTPEQQTPGCLNDIMYGLSMCSAFAPTATIEDVEAALKWLLSPQRN